MSSVDEMPRDVHERILSELEKLATSQHRIEAVLVDMSTMHKATMADITSDLASVVDSIRGRSNDDVAFVCKPRAAPAEEVANMSLTVALPDDPYRSEREPMQHMASRNSDVALALPSGWPSTITQRECFAGLAEHQGSYFGQRSKVLSTTLSGVRSTKTQGSPLELAGEAEMPYRHALFRPTMINPNSNLHMAFGLCSIVVLIYDLFIVPFLLAWDIPFDGFPHIASLCTACYWTVDVLLNFVSGYQRGGVLVMDPVAVAQHYMRTWFVPDIFVLLCDWTSILVVTVLQTDESSAGSLRMLRITKIGRLIRIIAMFRMIKLAIVIEEHVERKLSDTYRLILRIISMFCGTFWLNHLLACAWFALGRAAPSNTEAHWIDGVYQIGGTVVVFLDEDIVYQYVTSFHWSVSQITLGAIEIYACNTSERLFNILMLLLGLLFGCTMISSLSATMVEFQMLTKDKKEKLRTLRTYLRENNVDRKIALLVQQQATERLGKKAHLTEADVKAIHSISASLRTELHYEVCHRHIIRHPLLRLWADLDVPMAQRFCFECVNFLFPMPQDDIFIPGTSSDCCYLVISGTLSYTQEAGTSPVSDTTTMPVGAGQWLCEAAMWSNWTHVGTLAAQTECQLLVVHASTLDQILQRNRMIREITVEYSRHFYGRLTSSKPPNAPWPSDLDVPFTEYGDIVVSMDQGMQHIIGLNALEHVAASWSWHRGRTEQGLERLKEELETGKSTVTVNGKGAVERIVLVIAIRIEREDGAIFAQVAKKEGADTVPACQLPGGKQERGEMIGDAVKRILERLSLTENGIKIVDTERKTERKESKEYGVLTKYLRTVCHAKVTDQFEMPKMEICRNRAPRRSSQGSAGLVATKSLSFKFPTTDVFAISEKRKTLFYAWLTPAEFEQLRMPSGEALLLSWLAEMGAGQALPASPSKQANQPEEAALPASPRRPANQPEEVEVKVQAVPEWDERPPGDLQPGQELQPPPAQEAIAGNGSELKASPRRDAGVGAGGGCRTDLERAPLRPELLRQCL